MTRLPYTSLPVKEERGSSARICSQMSARLRLSLAGPTISFLVFYLATVSIFIPSRVFLQTNKSHPHHMKNEFHAIFPREIYIYIYRSTNHPCARNSLHYPFKKFNRISRNKDRSPTNRSCLDTKIYDFPQPFALPWLTLPISLATRFTLTGLPITI